MKIPFKSILIAALAVDVVAASTWFSKAAYNKWHETELERWLSDHDVPYPTPADRRDLEKLVSSNWESKVQKPLSDTSDSATNAYGSVKDWVFDSWTDSQLKSFLDKHGVPAPQPRKRDSLLKAVRENYESVGKKLGETTAYPGNWLYESWSDSDLKQFLDERGLPSPQTSNRDKLVSSVRRNAYLASDKASRAASSASSSASAAQKSLSDTVFDAWSDSQLKDFFDKHGIKVPQGSRRNEMIALARKHKSALTGGNTASSASSAFGAATTKAGNQYAQATDDAQLKSDDAFNSIVDTWTDSRLKGFLDSRGVPVPQGGKRHDLMAQVRLNKHKATTGYSAWTFDTWTTDNLKNWLSSQNKKATGSRDQLVKQAQDAYSSASSSGGSHFASVTSHLTESTNAAKDSTFETWSDSELKSYLDSYGVPNYQGSTINELRAMAKKNANYFRYGTSSPGGTFFAKVQDFLGGLFDQARAAAGYQQAKGTDYATEKATEATHRAGEAAQKASDRAKEEL